MLGKTSPIARAKPGDVPEYLITRLKLLYVSAKRFNCPCNVSSEYLVSWF